MTRVPEDILAGLCWAAIAITIWSGSLVMLRLGVTTSLNAYDLTALRFTVAAILLAPVVVCQIPALKRVGIVKLLLMVLGFGAPYALLVSLALQTAPASAAGALNPGVMAVTSMFLGWAYCREPLGAARSIGVGITLLGTALFACFAGPLAIGHGFLVTTGIMWAGYTLIVRLTGISALQAAAVVAVGSAILYLPVYLVALPKQLATAPFADVVMQAGFQGFLVSVVAIYAFNRSAELLGPATGATLPALIPVVTLVLGVMILGEVAGTTQVMAASLVGLGVALILAGRFFSDWFATFALRLNLRKQAR